MKKTNGAAAVLRRSWQMVSPYRGKIYLGAVCSLLATGLSTISAYTLRVLVDGETDDARWPLSARTAGGRLVHLVGSRDALGQYRNVRITDSNTWALFGEME